MKWSRARRSSNIEDRRGVSASGGGIIGKMGVGGIAAVMLVGWMLGKDPLEMLGIISQISESGQITSATTGTTPPTPVDDEASHFIASILGEAEDVWSELFAQSGSPYRPSKLVLFTDRIVSACGGAYAAMGPFYCPLDEKVYLDLGFFREMRTRLGGGGDFAEAYVIAHEIGHHIQTLTGVSQKVDDARRRGQNVDGDGGMLVRLELQADCYAGVWAHRAQQRHKWLEPGDIEEAMSTASAIGDDHLQKQSGGTVVPDAFTHGTAEQRMRWFRVGFETGEVKQCNTFSATRL